MFLGILLLYFIGKPFYNLAELHGKSKWGFAILAVATYYAGQFLGGLLMGFAMALLAPEMLDEDNTILFGLLALPFGLLAVWGVYSLLKKSWTKSASEKSGVDNILDSGI